MQGMIIILSVFLFCHAARACTSEVTVLENNYFRVSVTMEKGLIQIFRSNGDPLLTGAVAAVNTGREVFTSLDSRYRISVKILPLNDRPGKAEKMDILCQDSLHELDLHMQVTLYDTLQAILFELTCKNVSGKSLNIQSIEPLRIIREETGSLLFNDPLKCLTNGAMYYDAGMIHTFGEKFIKPEPYGETKGGKMMADMIAGNDQTVQSWWNVALFSGYNQEGMSLGFIENSAGLGRIRILKTGKGEFSFVAESVNSPGFTLRKDQQVSSDPFMISIGDDPYLTVEDYADAMGRIRTGKVNSIVNGWCNWFYTHTLFSEQEIVQNAAFAAQNLKNYGLEYIQIDEGFQQKHGKWEGNDRFPHGLKWLADTIKNMDLKPGIWIAPFVISENTEVFKNHPEWLLKNANGSLKLIGPWPNEDTDWFRNESPKRYALDITHPEAEKWFAGLIDTIANILGFEMIKIDFVAWTVFSAYHFYDLAFTPSQAYKKAVGIIRRVAGENCHILDCGPGNITLGLINSMRIEYDQNYGYRKDAWNQYFLGPSCSAGAAGKRYFYHKNTWINDADHVCMDLLSLNQAQAAATLISLTGGNMMSGDRLTYLDNSKLEVLKKVLPSTGENARPVDLFDNDPQTAFAVHFDRKFDNWTVAGFFNPDLDAPVEKEFPMQRLWLDSGKTYLHYDFWMEQYLGEVTGTIRINVDPGSVCLVSLHEKKGVPQFISTTRHAMQGAVEIGNIEFDPLTGILTGISFGPPGSMHDVVIYVPENYRWVPEDTGLFNDSENYSVKMADELILRISLKFDNCAEIPWKVVFEKR